MIGVVVPLYWGFDGMYWGFDGLHRVSKLFGSAGPDLWGPISLLIWSACLSDQAASSLIRCSQRSISSYALCRAAWFGPAHSPMVWFHCFGLVYFHPKTQIFSRFSITSNL